MKQAKDGSELAWIPPGSFEQGNDERDWIGPLSVPNREYLHPNVVHLDWEKSRHRAEKPVHTVTLKGFWLARTPVTVLQYRAFCDATKRKMPPAPSFDPLWSKELHPIVNVTWQEALAYARWAGGALPTEAQWEYAARSAGKRVRYPWGATFEDDNLWCGAYRDRMGTAPVVRTEFTYTNALGLVDLVGNVWEWCADWFAPYTPEPQKDPIGPPNGLQKVLRGGSWTANFALADFFRCTYRGHASPKDYDENRGFRVAFSPETVTLISSTSSQRGRE